MSFQSLVLQQLSDITARLNAIVQNAKRTFELPVQNSVVPTSLVRVSNDGISEQLTLQRIIDAAIEGSGTVTSPIEPPDYATIAALIANQDNQTPDYIQYVVDASADPSVPALDPNKARFYRYLGTVSGTIADYQVLSNTQSDVLINFAEKLDRGGYTGTAQDIVDLIPENFDVEWPDIEGPQGSVNLSGFHDDLNYATPEDLNLKVDKVPGKQLSDENYTLDEKQKLAGLEGSKWLGVYPSLPALELAHPTATAGNYADVDAGVGVDTIRYIWDDTDDKFVQSGSGAALTPAQIKQMYESNPDTNVFSDDEKSKLALITEIFTTALKNAYDSAVVWISTNGQNLLNHLGLTNNPHNVTLDQVLEQDNVSERNAQFGEVTAPNFIDTTGTVSVQSDVINLSDSRKGRVFNDETPSAANSFSVINLMPGGYATNYINTTGKTEFPTVTNAAGQVIPSKSDAFRADARFEMVLETLNGEDVLVYFNDYLNLEPPPSGGGSWEDIADKPTEFPPSPHMHVASDITDLESAITNNPAVLANTGKVSNVNADWDASNGDAQILNKPTRVNFNVYNQTKNNAVTVSNTVKTSIITITTGSKLIPVAALNSSYIGKVFGHFLSGGTSRNIEIEFKIASSTGVVTATNAGSAIVAFRLDYTINYTAFRTPNISGVMSVGNESYLIDIDINTTSSDVFDISATLSGGTLRINSSYLHRNHNS